MSRRTIRDMLEFPIPINGGVKTYKVDIFWKEVISTPNILPTDIFNGITWDCEKESGFLKLCSEDELQDYYIPKVLSYRERLETDDEYYNRMKQVAIHEEREYLEYLRLKAKYENKEKIN